MEKNELLKNIENYFANTSKEHLQKVYDELKDYNQYGPTVEEYLDGINSKEEKDSKINVELLRESNLNSHMFHLA